jgi:proteasome lid subunit RPN8/RPN11
MGLKERFLGKYKEPELQERFYPLRFVLEEEASCLNVSDDCLGLEQARGISFEKLPAFVKIDERLDEVFTEIRKKTQEEKIEQSGIICQKEGKFSAIYEGKNTKYSAHISIYYHNWDNYLTHLLAERKIDHDFVIVSKKDKYIPEFPLAKNVIFEEDIFAFFHSHPIDSFPSDDDIANMAKGKELQKFIHCTINPGFVDFLIDTKETTPWAGYGVRLGLIEEKFRDYIEEHKKYPRTEESRIKAAEFIYEQSRGFCEELKVGYYTLINPEENRNLAHWNNYPKT